MRISHLALFVTVVALTACGGRGGGLLARGTTVNPIVSGSVTGQPLVIDDDRAEARWALAPSPTPRG